MTRPDIWETVAEDGQQAKDFEPDLDSDCWLLMSDDEVIGLYNFHAHNSVTVEIHAQVLPDHRKEYSQETGLAALRWIYDYEFDGGKVYQKVIAQIPVIYENVKRFTCGFGFKVEGINRKSYLKGGVIVDQYLLGITRDEIAEVIT